MELNDPETASIIQAQAHDMLSRIFEEKDSLIKCSIAIDDKEQIMTTMTDSLNFRILPQTLDLKIKRLTDTAKLPQQSHSTDACFDIYADIPNE